jgi:hypothetical protein
MEQPFSSHDKLILFDLVNFVSKQPSPTAFSDLDVARASQ